MLKNLPAVVFGLSLVAIVVNTSAWQSAGVYIGAVIVGTLAAAVLYWQERKARPPSDIGTVAQWTSRRNELERTLADARAAGAEDRIAYLEPRLREASAMLRKLGG